MNEEQIYHMRYLVMPDYIYQDNRLTDIDRRLYCFIHSYKGNGTGFYFSTEQLASMFNCSEPSIKRAFSKLRRIKFIQTENKIKAGGGKIRYVYDLSEGSSMTTGKDHRRSLVYIKDNKIKDNKKKNIKKKDFSLLEQTVARLLVVWNETYGKNYTTFDAYRGNIEYWLASYPSEQIEQAIRGSKRLKFWGDIFTPAIFFRQFDKNKQRIDHIGDALNQKEEGWDRKHQIYLEVCRDNPVNEGRATLLAHFVGEDYDRYK